MIGLLWIGCVAVIIVAWAIGVPRLQAYATDHRSVDARTVAVRFTHQPSWVQGALADGLLRTAAMQIDGNPLQRDDLVAVREALLSTGWFDSVDQVRRVDSALVEIRAQFARPHTLIRDAVGHHLVDVKGKLLPKSYGPTDVLPTVIDPDTGTPRPMIAISGVHFPRPPVGDLWDGADVAAGLSLLRLIGQHPWRDQIAEIDVSQFLRDGPLRLLTDRGSVIIWGGPPGEEAALELMAVGKIQRLNLLYQNHGRIDANRFNELDLTGERVTVAR